MVKSKLWTAAICVLSLAAAGGPAFEVASIKLRPPVPGPLRASTGVGPAGIHYSNVTLKASIRTAYDVPAYLIAGGPDWSNRERFDIVANAAAPAPRAELMRMLQTLLEDRFQLKVHRESRESPVYALTVAKSGLKLHEGQADGATEIGGSKHAVDSRGMTMKALAGALTGMLQRLGRPVIDMTGLTGLYDITLDVPNDENAQGDIEADLIVALQRFGFNLESRKMPLEVLVIDRAERPTPN